jgi:hypothetical protein
MEKLVIDVCQENQPLFEGLMEFLHKKADEEVQARLGDRIHVEVSKLILDLEGRLIIKYMSWPKKYVPALG